jgi:outer membrane protein assembly factor BamB
MWRRSEKREARSEKPVRQSISNLCLAAALVLLCEWRARGGIVYGPPDSAADVAGELRVSDREVSEGNFAGAARRLERLLAANRGDALTEGGAGTLYTAAAWVEGLAPEARAALGEAQRKEHDAAARRVLEALRGGASATPEEFYAVARRYPLTRSAGDALELGADRALESGDLAGALALYELAGREGVLLDDVRKKRVELLRRVGAGEFVAMADDLSGGGGSARAKAGVRDVCGLAPIDAPWYGNASSAGSAKFFPWACGDRVVVGSWKSVVMFRDTGQVVWTAPNPKSPASFTAERATPTGRGVVFGACALVDVHGRAEIVVVRQPVSPGEGQFALRAYRGSDGKLLWASDLGEDRRKDLTYAGLPVVCGRYVYALAAARNDRSTGTLVLSALDVSGGEVLWQTNLGSIVEQSIDPRGGRKNVINEALDLSALADVTEPAVAGDLVVVSPGCGAVIAVGRFDGKVRWVHTYGGAEARAEKALRLRYSSTPAVCERAVVVLPQDAGAMIGLERGTGKRLWSREGAEGYAMAGAVGDVAVVSGASVAGVEALTGKPKWRYAPAGAARVTGPAVVMGQTVLVPTSSGVVQLDGISGGEKVVYQVPNLRRAVASEAGKQMLRDAGAEKGFGVPGVGK